MLSVLFADSVTKLKLWLQDWKNKPQIKSRKRKKKPSRKGMQM